MYIEKIKIGSFGKLLNREFDLTSGINVIEGENESGKSTLCEFIKFVFYGLSNRALKNDMSERQRHISWSTNNVSGCVVLNTGDKRYRIERSLTAYDTGYRDSVTVVDVDTNTVVEGIKKPGEHFFGVPEEVFTRTLYIRQTEGAYFNGGDIGQAVENIFYSADESVNTEKALKKLDDARVMIKHKKNTGRGMLEEQERERDGLEARLEASRRTNEEFVKDELSLKNTLAAIERNRKDGERLSGQLRRTELHSVIAEMENRKKNREAAESFKKSKADLKAATTFKGFFPDDAYVAEAGRVKNEIAFLKKSCDSYDVNEGVGEVGVYSKELAGIVRDLGGLMGIDKRLAAAVKKSRLFGTFSVLCGVLAIAAVVIGMFFGKTTLFSAVAYGIGCLFAIGGIAFAAVSFGALGKNKELVGRFDVGDERQLLELVAELEVCEQAEKMRNEKLAVRQAQKAELEDRLSKAVAVAVAHLAKWGRRPKSEKADDVTECLDSVVSDIAGIKKKISSYDLEKEKVEAVLGLLENRLSKYDEKSVVEEYNASDWEIITDNVDEVKRRWDFIQRANEALAEKARGLETRLAELRVNRDDPAELESRLAAVNERIDELSVKYEAYVLAHEKLQSAGVSLRNRLAPGLSAVAGTLMDGLTNGKYKTIGVSDALEMTYTREDENGALFTKTIDTVSSGTQDLAYISLRLALAALFGRTGKKLPVIFDEAFSRLDDGRLANMLSAAEKYSDSGAQIIIMTSRGRESKLFSEKGKGEKINCVYM